MVMSPVTSFYASTVSIYSQLRSKNIQCFIGKTLELSSILLHRSGLSLDDELNDYSEKFSPIFLPI